MSCLVPVSIVGFIHFIDGSLITIGPGEFLVQCQLLNKYFVAPSSSVSIDNQPPYVLVI